MTSRAGTGLAGRRVEEEGGETVTVMGHDQGEIGVGPVEDEGLGPLEHPSGPVPASVGATPVALGARSTVPQRITVTGLLHRHGATSASRRPGPRGRRRHRVGPRPASPPPPRTPRAPGRGACPSPLGGRRRPRDRGPDRPCDSGTRTPSHPSPAIVSHKFRGDADGIVDHGPDIGGGRLGRRGRCGRRRGSPPARRRR